MKHWVTALGLIALVGCGLWYGLELRARNWEGKWTGFVKKWESKGELFDVEGNLPAKLADESEFESHPWMGRIAANDPELLARLKRMDPQSIAGYDDWIRTEAPESANAPMPVELAERVRKHGAEFKAELDAFAEALKRSGCRISSVNLGGVVIEAGWISHLSAISRLFEGLSHAAIAVGDAATFTEMIETSLRAGQKLRASNMMLPIVVGAGFENVAFAALQSVPEPSIWPNSEQSRWLVALAYRTRTLVDEYAAVSRVERGFALRLIATMEKSSGGGSGISRFGLFRRVFFAGAKLASCEALQGMVLAPDGNIAMAIDPERIARFEEYVKDKRHLKDPAMELGLVTMVWPRCGIFKNLQYQESDRVAIRERLRKEQ